MRVIIPAASRGTRLQPLTDFSPKCMVDINGKPLIFHLLSELKRLEVSEVVIVTGHLGHMIEEYVTDNPEFPPVKCIYNKDFDSTNSIVSISLTTHLWNKDFCIIDSDLIIKPDLLQKLLNCKDTCLIIDNSKHPDKIDMKVKVENGRFLYMDKRLLRKETFGEFFGLSRWTPDSAGIFRKSIDKFIGQNETNVWYEWPIREMAKDYDLAIETCTEDMWIEIDNADDYSKAQVFLQQA